MASYRRPNVTGDFNLTTYGISSYMEAALPLGGAFSATSGYLSQAISYVGTSSLNGCSFNFDASRSNSVYTDSGKVYPLTIFANYLIKI